MNADLPSPRSHLHVIVISTALLIVAISTLQAQPTSGYKPHELGRSWKDRAEELLTNARDYKGAIELYTRWLEASPRDNGAWYNLACAYALSGDTSAALDALERSVDAGWASADLARTDNDLTTIRSNSRFDAALQRIEARKASIGPRGYIRRFGEMRSLGTYIVALPPDYATSGREYPVCLILHGSGSSEIFHGALADSFGRDGIIYVAPRAPYPSIDVIQSGGSGWTAWPPESIDPNDPAVTAIRNNYVDWIFNCVHDVQSNFRAAKGKIFIYGHSQGAYFANLCALKYPEEVEAYMAHAGRMPAAPFNTPESLAHMKQQGVRITLLHGEQDAVVLPDESKKYAEALKKEGVNCTLKLVQAGHTFNREITRLVREWVNSEIRSTGK